LCCSSAEADALHVLSAGWDEDLRMRSWLAAPLLLLALSARCEGLVQSQRFSVSLSTTRETLHVHALTASPPPGAPVHGTVILLHGAVFKAQTWNEVGSLEALAKAGFRAIAIDLPGYGDHLSGSKKLSSAAKETFLHDFIEVAVPDVAAGQKVGIIAASMGGSVATPFVVNHPDAIAGYVPVAAVLEVTSMRKRQNVAELPTLIVWGENDHPDSSRARMYKTLFPQHQMYVMPDAPHPCYLKDPELFNSLLIDFFAGPSPASKQPLHMHARW